MHLFTENSLEQVLISYAEAGFSKLSEDHHATDSLHIFIAHQCIILVLEAIHQIYHKQMLTVR